MKDARRSTAGAPAAAIAILALVACAPPATPQAAPARSPKPAAVAAPRSDDEAAPVLRRQSPALIEAGTVQGTVVGRFDDDGMETVAIAFPAPPALSSPENGNDRTWLTPEQATVVDPTGASLPSAFVASSPPGDPVPQRLWIRRPIAASPQPIRAVVVLSAELERPAGRFTIEAAAPTMPVDARQRAHFGVAFAHEVERRTSETPFGATAAARVRRLYVAPTAQPKGSGAHRDRERFEVSPDLASLMRSTTGVSALSAALAHDRALRVGPGAKRDVPIASLSLPSMESHPWAAMAAKLPAPPGESLATLVPADVWYVRARTLGSLFRLLDEADSWGTAAVRLAEDVAFDASIADRYETQLGLRRSAMSRAFGDGVVGEVAIVGSDPYIREGSDVTLLFRVKGRAAFDIALADSLAERARGHGAVTTSTVPHGGDAISIANTADGAVRRHRASVGDVELVSNSLGAIKRTLEAARGRAPSLGKELDVRYALARDASEPQDVLALVGEGLVRRVVGPAHKIGEARRQLARAELLAPGAAAVLHGWLRGAPPASADALVKSKLLAADELQHGDKQRITFEPGRAPRSPWGTPGFMTPLVDLPAIDAVSGAERDAYAQFKRAYEEGWAGEPFDPIAVRVVLPEQGPLTAHVRVLPIPRDRDIDELLRVVGAGRVRAESTPDGGRFVLALSGDERWREDLGLPLGRMIGGDRRALDWIGDWGAVGIADRNGLLHAIRREVAPEPLEKEHRRYGDEEIAELTRIPLWIGVGVRSPATLGLLLTLVRKLAADAMPNLVSWGEAGKEGDASIVAVRIAGEAIDDSVRGREIAIYYSIVTGGPGGAAFYASLKEDVLRKLLREHATGRGPRAPARGETSPAAAQALLDVVTREGGPLATALVWASEHSAREHSRVSRQYAGWFLHGASTPEAAQDLARAYLGAAPTTPSGKPFTTGPTGVTDPDRGNDIEPLWPALPVPGTPIAAVASRLGRIHVETRFDDEPGSTKAAPLRSFAARISIEPRR